MIDLTNLHLERTWQYAAYILISLVGLIFIVILLPSSGIYFRRFFGELNALIVTVLASIVGAFALWLLQEKSNFVLFMGKGTIRGVKLSAVLASVLAMAIVVADFFIRYPEDTNVPIPQALLFYPAVGFIAEIVFHVLPLALLLIFLNPLGGWIGKERVIWLGILVVAVLEPTFQVLFEGRAFTWGAAYTWIHVFALAFLQLYTFRRFDFVSMYSFRLVYYAYWHILWGVIRLKVLFGY
ncbi:MAG: hypothetical protein ACW97O_17430 [Candidatus Thorarchaeota archaeon]